MTSGGKRYMILQRAQDKCNENSNNPKEKSDEKQELKSVHLSVHRSKSLDSEEIKDIIEFDDVIQSLIKDEFLANCVEDGTTATFIGTEDSYNPDESDLSNNERIMRPVAVDDDGCEKEVDVNFFRDSDISISIKNSYFNDSSENEFSSIIKPKSFFRRSKSLSSISQESIHQSKYNTTEDNDDNVQKHSLHVQFGDVEERIYSLILGDHPNVSSGPPTALSWNYSQNEKTDILTYEAQKPFPRGNMKTLHMSKMHREFLLREKGYSRMELNDAVRSVNKSVRNRKITNDFSKYQVAAYDARFSIKHVARSIGKSLNAPLKPILKSV